MDRSGYYSSDRNMRNIIYDILRNWWVPLLFAFGISLVAESALSLFYRPMYTSSTTVAVTSKARTANNYSSYNQNSSTAQILTSILTSTTMKKLVVQELGMDSFDAHLKVSTLSSTNILNISVTADNPRSAYIILRTLMKKYPEISQYIIQNSTLDVLEEARIPYGPSNGINTREFKKKAFLAALALAVFVMGLYSHMRDTIYSEEDIASKLDISVFSSIPHESKYKTIKEYIKHGKKSVLISNVSSSYLFVEAFYKLRTKLEYVMGKKDHKVLLITSVRENEGKSSVAANTALALASGGKKVLLIDCDLRNPSQNKLFEIKPEKGSEFADYLYGRCPFEEAVWKDDRYGLNLMVSRIPRENSVEILSNPSMEKLIENMRKEMDYIILDTSPMLLTADAEHLLRHADAALLVIKQNYSSAININDATDILTSYKAELLGCVFNDVHHGIFEKGQKAYYGKGRYTGQYEINAAAENMYEQQDS